MSKIPAIMYLAEDDVGLHQPIPEETVSQETNECRQKRLQDRWLFEYNCDTE
jgi:hypothetical protein